MQKVFVFLVFVLFLTSCADKISFKTAEKEQAVQQTVQEEKKETAADVIREAREKEVEEEIGEYVFPEADTEKPPVACTDPDGDDPYKFGKVIIEYDEINREGFKDECIGLGYIVEHYCEGVYHKSRNYKCEVGCEAGACTK